METAQRKPKVKLVGQDGNAFMVLGLCHRAAKKAGWTDDQWKSVRDKMMSGDYDNLLATAVENFEVC